MDLIPSFSVDHTRIVPGIFTSRIDIVGDQMVTTYDVRVTKPNTEPAVEVAAMHSLEHIIATFLRNDPDWKDQEIYDLILRGFQSVEDYEDVPGTSPENCGNYLLHNLGMAKWYARKFAAYLTENAENPGIFEYPRSERLVTEDGRQFFDS